MSGFFTNAIGLSSLFKVSARAVASLHASSVGTSALFAQNTSCSTHDYTLDVSGNDVHIVGILTSNGSVHIHGSGEQFAELDWRADPTSATGTGCALTTLVTNPDATHITVANISGFAVGDTIYIDADAKSETRTVTAVATATKTITLSTGLSTTHAAGVVVTNYSSPSITGSPFPTFTPGGVHPYTGIKNYPLTFDRPTVCSQPGVITGSSFTFTGSISSGIYCATGDVSISGNSGTANVTIVGRCIDYGANGGTLSSFYPGLFMYATGTSADCAHGNAIDFHGNGVTIGTPVTNSTFYAPNGAASLSGNSGNAIYGFVEADTIFTHGNTWSWTGTGPSPGSGSSGVSLDE